MKYYINLFFAQSLGIKYNGGLDYAYNLLHQLQESKEDFTLIVLSLDVENIDEMCRDYRLELIKVSSSKEISSLLNKEKEFVLFEPMPYNAEEFIRLHNHGKFYIVIHGLRDVELPNTIERLKYGNFYKELVKFVFIKKFKEKLVDKYNKLVALDNVYVITVSFYSKSSIEFYLDNSKDVMKIYPPVQKKVKLSLEKDNNILKKINVKENNYILMTGSERWSKNTKYVTKAIFELLTKHNYKIDILILGSKPNSIVQYSGFNVIHFEYLDDVDFEIIMKNAFLFVYPSLNEGFGYPPLYAMKLGTPVVASSISSIAEVLSSGSLYFCPLEKDDIILKIDTLISNNSYREQLINDGYKRYKKVEELQREDFKKVLNLFNR